MGRKWSIVHGDFWDAEAARIGMERMRERRWDVARFETLKHSIRVEGPDSVNILRKGRELEAEISRVWDRVRPPKGGDSGGLFLLTVAETRPRKPSKKPRKRFSKRRESQIVRGSVQVRYEKGRIVSLRSKKTGRFVSFK